MPYSAELGISLLQRPCPAEYSVRPSLFWPDYQSGAGAGQGPFAIKNESLLLCFATMVFRPMAAVNTSIANNTDATLCDISCLPGMEKPRGHSISNYTNVKRLRVRGPVKKRFTQTAIVISLSFRLCNDQPHMRTAVSIGFRTCTVNSTVVLESAQSALPVFPQLIRWPAPMTFWLRVSILYFVCSNLPPRTSFESRVPLPTLEFRSRSSILETTFKLRLRFLFSIFRLPIFDLVSAA